MSRIILLILIFLSAAVSAAGRDSLYHDVSFKASAGYNLPSHGFYRGYNSTGEPVYANTSGHLRYSFGFQPSTSLGSLYPNVTQGIGIAGLTFYNHNLLGSPILIYVFQNARIVELTPDLGLDYGWEFGGSYGWESNEIIATKANIYVNVGLRLSWNMTKLWSLSFGPDFSHFSNGDTKYPNGGANLINFQLGLTGHVVPQSAPVVYESQLCDKTFVDRMEYDLVVFGGWRAGKVTNERYAVINEVFPVFGMNFMPSYRLNRYISAGASIDLLADRSANLSDVIKDSDSGVLVSYTQPTLLDQVAAGVTVRGEITMPIFAIGLGIGGFVLPSGNSLRGLYSTFSLKTFMTEHVFLNVSYRLSARNFTHNMMYGLGWRF